MSNRGTTVSWIKLSIDLFGDDKIRLIDALPERDAIFVIWIRILTLAGKSNRDGALMLSDRIPYNAEMIATLANRPISTVRLAIETFESMDMIEIHDETIYLPNWSKYQNVESLEKIREQNRVRQQRYRENRAISDEQEEKKERRLERERVTLPVTLHDGKDKDTRKGIISHPSLGVPMNQTRYDNLCKKHTQEVVDRYIERIINWEASKGKAACKDYAAAAANWIARDIEKGIFQADDDDGLRPHRAGDPL